MKRFILLYFLLFFCLQSCVNEVKPLHTFQLHIAFTQDFDREGVLKLASLFLMYKDTTKFNNACESLNFLPKTFITRLDLSNKDTLKIDDEAHGFTKYQFKKNRVKNIKSFLKNLKLPDWASKASQLKDTANQFIFRQEEDNVVKYVYSLSKKRDTSDIKKYYNIDSLKIAIEDTLCKNKELSVIIIIEDKTLVTDMSNLDSVTVWKREIYEKYVLKENNQNLSDSIAITKDTSSEQQPLIIATAEKEPINTEKGQYKAQPKFDTYPKTITNKKSNTTTSKPASRISQPVDELKLRTTSFRNQEGKVLDIEDASIIKYVSVDGNSVEVGRANENIFCVPVYKKKNNYSISINHNGKTYKYEAQGTTYY